MPFYGAALDQLVEAPDLEGIVARGAGGAPDRLQTQLLEDLAQRAGITDDEIAAELGVNYVSRGPTNWEWVHAVGSRAVQARSVAQRGSTQELPS